MTRNNASLTRPLLVSCLHITVWCSDRGTDQTCAYQRSSDYALNPRLFPHLSSCLVGSFSLWARSPARRPLGKARFSCLVSVSYLKMFRTINVVATQRQRHHGVLRSATDGYWFGTLKQSECLLSLASMEHANKSLICEANPSE